MEITIGYLYPENLNLYGDRGNVEALLYNLDVLGISGKVFEIATSSAPSTILKSDILVMGGGADISQKLVVSDFVENKGGALREAFHKKTPGLFVCGAYQLLGKYYLPFSGNSMLGLNLANFYTKHFGLNKKRCVGNVVVDITKSPFCQIGFNELVGFENHGGRTYIADTKPLGFVKKGFGNNGQDKTEGVLINNFVGTYLHGPILPKNPHLTFFLINEAVKQKYQTNLNFSDLGDITLEKDAFNLARRLKR